MVSKKYVGIISLLTLGVLLSSKKIHDFLLLTMTGRLTLIVFILGISYLNISMGLISVVMIILMISNYDGIYEGYSNISVIPIVPTLNNTPKEETIGREGFNMIDRDKEDLLVEKIQNWQIKSKSHDYYAAKNLGICNVVKRIPSEGSLKFLKLSRPGFEYNEEEKDFILSQLYNYATQELQPSLQDLKKSKVH